MKTIEITLYKYNELPTEEAKEKARQWWIELESRDPCWISEHRQSMDHACNAFYESDKRKVLDESEECKWTGYCADALFASFVRENGWPENESQIIHHYEQEWEKELKWRLEDNQVEDIILANEYEFLQSGEFYN